MHALRAYLDAGSGSIIIQAVIGGFAAAAVSIKLFWRRILTFLGIRKEEDETSAVPTATAAQADTAAEPQPVETTSAR